MIRRVLLAVVLCSVFVTMHAAACTPRAWRPNDSVTNEPVKSANGRFALIVRRYPTIPDFESVPAGTVFKFEEGSGVTMLPAVPTPLIAALYDMSGVEPLLMSEIPVQQDTDATPLLSSNGRYFAFFRDPNLPCHAPSADPLLTIYSSRGMRIAAVDLKDVLNPYDASIVGAERLSIRAELRPESEGREVVVLKFPGDRASDPSRVVERRIDVRNGTMLDTKTDVFDVPRVFATRAETASGGSVNGYVNVAPAEFFAHIASAPVPEYPRVARLARVVAAVAMEVFVSETGEVLSTRFKFAPFGIAQAAEAAVMRWKFRPWLVDGKPVKVRGDILLHFENVAPAKWPEIARSLPPG